MSNRFDPLTKGLISVAVILMFAAALVAGQARANLTDEAAAADFVEHSRTGILLSADILRKIESLPAIVGAAFVLPGEMDLCIDALRPGTSGARRDDSLVK
jgi:hypothetical protein